MSTLSRLRRGAAVALVLSALSACQALIDPNGTQNTVEGIVNSDASDRAMSALTRGDYPTAERYALTALRYNSRDGMALLAAGLAYQGLGRYDLARQYYEVIITGNIPGSIMTPGDGGVVMPRSILDIARANMAAIDKMTGRYVPRSAAESGRAPGASAVGAPSLPFGDAAPLAATDRPQVGTGSLRPIGADGGTGIASAAEVNATGRFRILKRLLDEGLITPDEYRARRTANTGALLPYTGQAPSVGLERPIPSEDALSARLRALAQSLEGRAITAAEHAAERTTILDALLPDKPRRTEMALLPPRDLLEAGQAIGRTERLAAAGLISSDEARKEKAAIDQRYNTYIGGQRVEGSVTGLRSGTAPAPAPATANGKSAAAAKATGKWGVSLANATTEDEARTLWEGIKRKFPEELGKHDASFRPNADGSKWRVLVGPLASKTAATKLCKTLKLHRQSCDPAGM